MWPPEPVGPNQALVPASDVYKATKDFIMEYGGELRILIARNSLFERGAGGRPLQTCIPVLQGRIDEAGKFSVFNIHHITLAMLQADPVSHPIYRKLTDNAGIPINHTRATALVACGGDFQSLDLNLIGDVMVQGNILRNFDWKRVFQAGFDQTEDWKRLFL